jgi:hypothetical protein
MDLKILQETPPWDWPRDSGKTFSEELRSTAAIALGPVLEQADCDRIASI